MISYYCIILLFYKKFYQAAYNKTDKHNFVHVYNSNTCSLLGKADFLITDKTGTLTNGQRMSFACLYIEGRVYGELTLTKNEKTNRVKRSTCSYEDESSKLVQKKARGFKRSLIFHLNCFISSYFPIEYYKQKSKVWKFIHSVCKKEKKTKSKIEDFENAFNNKKNSRTSHKHQIFHFRSPVTSVRMLYPKFSSKPLINKRCFSCPSIIISHTTPLNKSKKSIKSFQCTLCFLFP
jgi:magnesium-transporting ATPase (P-type)